MAKRVAKKPARRPVDRAKNAEIRALLAAMEDEPGVPKSPLERLALAHIRRDGLPEPEKQYEFARPERRWAADFAWVAERIILDIQGIGRHQTLGGYIKDTERSAEAQLRGWIVLYATGSQVRSGAAMEWVRRALAARGAGIAA